MGLTQRGFTTSAGKEIDAYGGIFGIGLDDEGKIVVTSGYDDQVDPFGYVELTLADKKELAINCIELWMKYGGLSREDIAGGSNV